MCRLWALEKKRRNLPFLTGEDSEKEGSIKHQKLTTRKKLINDTFNASLKSYNDTSLKCHGLDYQCISLHTMTLISSVIFVNQNYDIHLKRHSLLIIFQSNNLTMTLI